MSINIIKSIVDKADTIKRQIQQKNKEMDAALIELVRVQKNIASIGQDLEKLQQTLGEVEDELRPMMVDYLKVQLRTQAIS